MRGKTYHNTYETKVQRMTEDQAYDTRLWQAVHDAAIAKTGDVNQAVTAADNAVELVRKGRNYDADARVAELRRQRQLRWRKFNHLARWLSALAAVVLVVLLLIRSIGWMQGNDYASLDQKYITDLARNELEWWYGDERLGEHQIIRGKEKSHYFNMPAWKVKFYIPGSQGIVDDTACVFLWGETSDQNEADEVAIREGTNC